MNRFVRLSAIRRFGVVLMLGLLGLAALLSGCDLIGNEDDEGDAAEEQAVEQQAAPEAEADEEPARVSAPLPPAPTSFDAATIFSIVRPSLALVQTDQGVATGLATRTGEVFVGASAIAGATTISVTFSNGRVAEDVSVTQIDYVTDLAVLGPVGGGATTGLPLVNLGDGEALPIGAPVYIVGFSRAGLAAGASLSAGLLSRRAEWAAPELTLISSDASIADDQVGLVMVDQLGSVIGIAPASLAARGLFVSAADITRMLPFASAEERAMTVMGPDDDVLLLTISAFPGERSLVLVTEPDPESGLTLTINGDQPGAVTVTDLSSQIVATRAIAAGLETVLLAELTTRGPYSVWVTTEAEASARYTIESKPTGMVGPDLDDRRWEAGVASSAGVINPASDRDTIMLDVRRGDVYEVRVESLTVDVYLFASGAGVDATDDDGVGGLSGTDAGLRIEPTESGQVELVVGAIEGSGMGGYVISIEQIAMAPEAAAAEAGDDQEADEAMMMGPSFPAFPDPPAIAMRGSGGARGLNTDAVSRGHDAGNNMLAVADADGSFEVTVTILGETGAIARVLVSDAASGSIVFESSVSTTCSGAESCIASSSANPREAGEGEWIVVIEHGGGGSIEQWQVEVSTDD